MGKIPVGEPGSKEVVDFGNWFGIHTRCSDEAQQEAAQNGVVHYSRRGNHVVPSRPLMSISQDLTVQARLSVQRALLGEVPPALRAVVLSLGDFSVGVNCYFDGPISDDDLESMSYAETEMIADLQPDISVRANCIRCDAPEVVSDEGTWVFERRERK